MTTRKWIRDTVQGHVEKFLDSKNKKVPLTTFNGRGGYLLEDVRYFGVNDSMPKHSFFLLAEDETLYRVGDNGLAKLDKELDANGFPQAVREALGV